MTEALYKQKETLVSLFIKPKSQRMNRLFLLIVISCFFLKTEAQKNIISGSTKSVIQVGDNNTVNYNLNASLEDIYVALEAQKREVKIFSIEQEIVNVSSYIIALENHLTELEQKVEEIKDEDEEVYIKGKTNILKAKIAIQEIKNFESNFSVADSIDVYGNVKYYIQKDSSVRLTDNLYSFISDFQEGIALVKYYNKYGFVDYTGLEVIPPQYDKAITFNDGLALVEKEDFGKKLLIDKTGQTIKDVSAYRTIERTDFGFYKVSSSDYPYRTGLLDSKGNQIIELKYKDLNFTGYQKQIRAVYGNRYGIIDLNEKVILPFNYQFVSNFSDPYYAVKQSNKWGYFKVDGEQVIGFKYDQASLFKDGYASVQVQQKWGLIDANDIQYLPPKFDKIREWDDEIVQVDFEEFSFTFNTLGECINNCRLFYSLDKREENIYGRILEVKENEIEIELFSEAFNLSIDNFKPLNKKTLYNNLVKRIREGCVLIRRESVEEELVYIVDCKYIGILDSIGEYKFDPNDLKITELEKFNTKGKAKATKRNRYDQVTIDVNGNEKKSLKKAFSSIQKRRSYESLTFDLDLLILFNSGFDINITYLLEEDFEMGFGVRFNDQLINYYSSSDFKEESTFALMILGNYRFNSNSKVNGLGLGIGFWTPAFKLTDNSGSEITYGPLTTVFNFSYELEYFRNFTFTPFVSPSFTGLPLSNECLECFLSGTNYQTNSFNLLFGIRMGYKTSF